MTEYWMWLAEGLGYGAVNSGEVLKAYPDGPVAVQQDLGGPRLDEILTQKQANALAQSRPEDFALRIRHAQTMGVQVLGYDEPSYPGMLRTIHNPPPVVFVKGNMALLNGQLAIAMVGARRPSAYGVEVMKTMGRGIAMGGAIIVSGLAAGLDSHAHKAALAVNGPTIACIAFGHDICYPAANQKLMDIIERYGAIISEYPPGTEPKKPYFLHRNRIIAGFSHGLVVVEARSHSGTMSTVNFAADYGRDVFAVPGSVFSPLSSGTNATIREGAYLAASAADVLGVYGIELKEEDPVVAASRLSSDGMPLDSEQAAWQQSASIPIEKAQGAQNQASSGAMPNIADKNQSLGEVLRSQLNTTDGRVSAAQAVQAFQNIQQQMPAAERTGSMSLHLDAHSITLQERASAVSDSVQITKRSAEKPKGNPKKAEAKKESVSLYPWHQVERLDRKSVKDLSSPVQEKPQKQKSKAPSLGAQIFGLSGRENASEEDYTMRNMAEYSSLQDDFVEDVPSSRMSGDKPQRVVRDTAQQDAPLHVQREVRSAPQDDFVEDVLPSRVSGDKPQRVIRTTAQHEEQRAPREVVRPMRPQQSGSAHERAQEQVQHVPSQAQRQVRSTPQDAVVPVYSRRSENFGAELSGNERTQEHAQSEAQSTALPELDVKATVLRPLGRGTPLAAKAAYAAGGNIPRAQQGRQGIELSGRLNTLGRDAHVPQQDATRLSIRPQSDKDISDEKDTQASALSDIAQRALKQLSAVPMSLADICERSGLSGAEAMAALTELELSGLSRQLAGRQFVAGGI